MYLNFATKNFFLKLWHCTSKRLQLKTSCKWCHSNLVSSIRTIFLCSRGMVSHAHTHSSLLLHSICELWFCLWPYVLKWWNVVEFRLIVLFSVLASCLVMLLCLSVLLHANLLLSQVGFWNFWIQLLTGSSRLLIFSGMQFFHKPRGHVLRQSPCLQDRNQLTASRYMQIYEKCFHLQIPFACWVWWGKTKLSETSCWS